MNSLSIASVVLILSTGFALAQAGGGGGGSAGGGSAGGGGTTAPGAASTTQGASPGARSIAPTTPARPAPGVANTPVDPARNNVDVNPPTSNQPTSPPHPTASPSDRIDQPGGASSGRAATRPGAAQGANSDGYAECMAMWSPANTRMSQQEWTKTCDNARLKQR